MASEWDVVSHDPVATGGDPWAVVSHDAPSTWDRIVASPVGRLAHDAVVAPISGLANIATSSLYGGALTPLMDKITAPIEGAYQGSLARNRNTPGYAAARDLADKGLATGGGSGLMDQALAPILPALHGTLGGLFGGSLDSANASADAQTAAQGNYQQQHPYLSTAAGVVGGLAMGAPELAPGRAGAAAGQLSPFAAMPKLTPADAGLEYVQRLMQTGNKAPADLRAAAAAVGGKPITSAEAIGKPAEVGLGALARREGQTADAFGGLGLARQQAAPGRILDDFAAASGIDPRAARGDIEGLIEANQKAAKPLYDEAYKTNTNIASPMLDRILETPAGKKSLADARVKMQNDMSLMGTPDAELMDQAAEGGTVLPPKGAASGMKLRVYDYIKKSLDEQISAAYSNGASHEGGIIKDLKNRLVNELDKADITAQAGPNSLKPEGGAYAQARAKAGEYLSAKKNFELGQQQILDDKVTAQDFAAEWKKLGDADKQAKLGGGANKLFNLQQQDKMRAAVFKSPLIREKLAVMMGRDKAEAFIANMGTEQKMAEFIRKRAPGAGSPTAEYQQAMIDQDGNSALALDALKVGGNALARGPRAAIADFVGEKAQKAVASYITRGMAVPVRDEAGRLLMLPPADLAKVLETLPQVTPQSVFPPPAISRRNALPLGMFGSGYALSGQSGR